MLPLTGTTGEQLGELRVWRAATTTRTPSRPRSPNWPGWSGVRLENAQLYEAEHRIATTLQHSLLPQSLPQLPGAVRGQPLPAGQRRRRGRRRLVRRDRRSPDDELVLVIGDVVGKGVQAAAAMGQLRNALRAYMLEGFDPR